MTPTAQRAAQKNLPCDGCGHLSTPEHIAARIARLQWATRFRPIHIQALFLAPAPQPSGESVASADGDEGETFPPSAIRDYGALLDGLGIPGPPAAADLNLQAQNFLSRLTEFQRRGFYLGFLSECALTNAGGEAVSDGASELCAQYGPTLIKRIQYSYKPKQIVPLSHALGPLVTMIERAGLGESLVLDNGSPFELPRADGPTTQQFQSAWEREQAGGKG
jgi:hypothetical protein